MVVTLARLEQARQLIDQHAEEWTDFCQEVGHLPRNVQYLPAVQRDFAEWLEDNE
jgi:hypothetical protein